MKKVCVVGIGYVGMAYAVLLAQNNIVYAVDIDMEKLNLLIQRKTVMHETGLRKALSKIPED